MKLTVIANPIFGLHTSEISLILMLGLAWIDPVFIEQIQPGFIAMLPVIFVAEFIFGHAGVGLSLLVFFQGILRWLAGLFVISLYGGFLFLVFQMGFPWLLIVNFVWVTVSRGYRAEVSFRKDKKTKVDRADLYARLAMPPFIRTFILIFCLLLATVLPLPELGLSNYSGNPIGTGSLVEHPQTSIFLLMIYYASASWLETKILPIIQKHFF